MDRPILRQRLGSSKNLFHQHVNGAAVARERNSERLCAASLQFLKIVSRQIEAVRVIDAQTGHCAGSDQFENKLVGCIKNFRHFNANGREIVYVKDATVVDYLGG